jgi:hypothetical protein
LTYLHQFTDTAHQHVLVLQEGQSLEARKTILVILDHGLESFSKMDRVSLLGLPRECFSGPRRKLETLTHLIEVDFVAEQLHLLRHALHLFFDFLSIGKIVDFDALGRVTKATLFHGVSMLSLLYRLLSLYRLRLANLL